jgi:hypothetical protein
MMQMSSDHKKNLVPESRASAIIYDELGLRVLNQLKSKKVVLVFDNTTETCTILKSDDPVLNDLI